MFDSHAFLRPGGTGHRAQSAASCLRYGPAIARQSIIASLVNTPPTDSVTVVDDLAALTGTPVLFVLQFLKELEAKDLLKDVLTAGNPSRLAGISPALRRLL